MERAAAILGRSFHHTLSHGTTAAGAGHHHDSQSGSDPQSGEVAPPQGAQLTPAAASVHGQNVEQRGRGMCSSRQSVEASTGPAHLWG